VFCEFVKYVATDEGKVSTTRVVEGKFWLTQERSLGGRNTVKKNVIVACMVVIRLMAVRFSAIK